MRGKRQQSDIPGLLDGAGQAALVRGANAGEPTGHDLAAFSHKLLQQTDIAVRDRVDLLGTELAYLLAAEEFTATTGAACRAGSTRAGARTGAGRRSAGGLRWSVRRSGRLGLSFFRHCVSSLLSFAVQR